MNICSCGCGTIIKENKNFVHGHNRKGVEPSEETKKRIGEKSKLKIYSKEYRKKLSDSQKKIWQDQDSSYNSQERSNKISKTMKENQSMVGEKNHRWKGGEIRYLHKKARQLFEKDNCEICGKSKEENFKEVKDSLVMHCTSEPKNYRLMEQSNWKTVCTKCHCKLDFKKRKTI